MKKLLSAFAFGAMASLCLISASHALLPIQPRESGGGQLRSEDPRGPRRRLRNPEQRLRRDAQMRHMRGRSGVHEQQMRQGPDPPSHRDNRPDVHDPHQAVCRRPGRNRHDRHRRADRQLDRPRD
jgi:hypothetical protein